MSRSNGVLTRPWYVSELSRCLLLPSEGRVELVEGADWRICASSGNDTSNALGRRDMWAYSSREQEKTIWEQLESASNKSAGNRRPRTCRE